jgi:chromosome segregation ATPase
MWNLEYELVAILLIAAIIGLLMGRFLCKSGEADEKAKKISIITAYKALQIDFNKSEARLNEQVSISHVYEDTLAEQKQSITNLATKLASSNKHSAKHLEDVKVLAKYQTRFEALTKEFEIQNSKIEMLKNEKDSNIETIDGFETSSRILDQNFNSLNYKHDETVHVLEEVSLLSKEQKKQIDALLERESYLLQELKNFKIDKHDRLLFLEKEYTSISTKLNTAIDERDDLMTRIRAISSVVGAVGVEEE